MHACTHHCCLLPCSIGMRTYYTCITAPWRIEQCRLIGACKLLAHPPCRHSTVTLGTMHIGSSGQNAHLRPTPAPLDTHVCTEHAHKVQTGTRACTLPFMQQIHIYIRTSGKTERTERCMQKERASWSCGCRRYDRRPEFQPAALAALQGSCSTSAKRIFRGRMMRSPCAPACALRHASAGQIPHPGQSFMRLIHTSIHG